MRARRWLFSILLLALSLTPWCSAAGGSGPATLTVRIFGGATKTSLRLQPGFATVLRADHRIDTVAIGDPRLVTATTVKRGQDVYDLVLQPQTANGITNMVVWFGELTSVWELTISPGQRTADIVYVVTAPVPTPRPAAPGPSTSPTAPTAPAPPSPALLSPSPTSVRVEAPTEPSSPANGLPFLEAQQTIGDVVGRFQVIRGRDGVRIRYRIANNGTRVLSIRLSGILVRLNGHLAPFGMARDHVDKDRPATLPGGATETGIITIPLRTARQVEIIFSLFPVEDDKQGPSRVLPVTFQTMFAGLDRLPVSPAQ